MQSLGHSYFISDKNDKTDNTATCRFNGLFTPSEIKTTSGGIVVLVGLDVRIGKPEDSVTAYN